jgi:hypothetical protein
MTSQITMHEKDFFDVDWGDAIKIPDGEYEAVYVSHHVTNGSFGTLPIQSGNAAFLYDLNNNIVRYTTSTDVVFDSYSTFAIKIVPVSDSTAIVPRVSDMRVLALQA